MSTTDLTPEQERPVCPICQGTGQMISDEPPTHQPCSKCTAYPWTVYRGCRSCPDSPLSTRFRIAAVWRDSHGTRWARYACNNDHTDYWTVTRQVFADLTAATQEEE